MPKTKKEKSYEEIPVSTAQADKLFRFAKALREAADYISFDILHGPHVGEVKERTAPVYVVPLKKAKKRGRPVKKAKA